MKKILNVSSLAVLFSLLVLGSIYVTTLLPGLGYTDDTAEFQFVGRILGVPHLTGYPVYTVINHLFTTLLPGHNIAYKANLLSALFMVMAAGLLFLLLRSLKVRPWVASISAIIFGLTLSVWIQAIIAEIYALNLLFVAVVHYFLIRWFLSIKEPELLTAAAGGEPNRRHQRLLFYLAMGFYAFSFGNHLTMVTFLPAILYLVWATDVTLLRDRKSYLVIGLMILLGALQYTYLFWRFYDRSTPYLAMQTPDVRTLAWYMSGGHAKNLMAAFSLRQLFTERIPLIASLVFREYGLLLPVVIYGWLKISHRSLRIFFIFGVVGNLIYALNYNVSDVWVYILPSYFIFAVCLGQGLEKILDWVPFRRLRWLPLMLLGIPGFLVYHQLDRVNVITNNLAGDQISRVLEKVGGKAVIVCPNSHVWHYFLYHLLVGDFRDRSIYIYPLLDAGKVYEYIYKGSSIYLFDTRQTIPAGLDVYYYDVQSTFHEKLPAEKYQYEPVMEKLFRLHKRDTSMTLRSSQ